MDIMERLRWARDRATRAEEIERQRLADADTAELQQAASVRLATRQAVRETLDDLVDGPSEGSGGDGASALTGTSTAAEEPEASYAGSGTPIEGDVQREPGTQTDG